MARSYGYYHDRILQNLAFEDLVAAAEESYASGKSKVETSIFPAIAYTALVPKFLKRMTKAGFNPVTEKVNYGPLSKQCRLLMAGLRGKI